VTYIDLSVNIESYKVVPTVDVLLPDLSASIPSLCRSFNRSRK